MGSERVSKRVWRTAALFVVLIVVAAWPSRDIRAYVSSALCFALNPLLDDLQFGNGGHASVSAGPVNEVRRPGESVSSDAEIHLRVDTLPHVLTVSINLRRDFYLPLVIFSAAVTAAPLSWRRRSAALLLGLPVAFYLCFSALFVTICWLFAHQAPAFYPLSERELALLDSMVSMFLMPPTPRFFIPILTSVAMLIGLGRARRAAD